MNNLKQTLFFTDDRLFIGNVYVNQKFDKLYNFLLLEHAIDLFTPKTLLLNIKRKLREETSLVYLTGLDILTHLDKNTRKKFKKFYGETYQLYVLYCDPLKDIERFTWKR